MIVRFAIFGLLAAGMVGIPSTVSAKSMSRREIREMPITARPSRPGHFYGNAVRRNTGQSGRQQNSPVSFSHPAS